MSDKQLINVDLIILFLAFFADFVEVYCKNTTALLYAIG